MHTPLELDIILHYHVHADDWRGGSFTAPVCDETFNKLVKEGLLADNMKMGAMPLEGDTKFSPTDKLHAFCELLCCTPLPVQVWCHPDLVKDDNPLARVLVRNPGDGQP